MQKTENLHTKKSIYANALLSDGKILFWRTGQDKKTVYDFYKDFSYANINQLEYFETHNIEVKTMEFSYCIEEELCEYDLSMNELIFEVLSKEFYRQFDISPDSKGVKPY